MPLPARSRCNWFDGFYTDSGKSFNAVTGKVPLQPISSCLSSHVAMFQCRYRQGPVATPLPDRVLSLRATSFNAVTGKVPLQLKSILQKLSECCFNAVTGKVPLQLLRMT